MTGEQSVSGPARPRFDPDADLLKALARGEHNALAALMDRHLTAIKSLAWYILGDEMMAEDITQEVFLKAWKQAPDWQFGKAKFSTWLHRVVKNQCYDRLRKKTEIFTDEVPDVIDGRETPHKALVADEVRNNRRAAVALAMGKLPERQSLAIILCYYRNLSQNEAAEIMEIGVRAYESLLARGRRNLRELLSARKMDLLGERS